MKLRADLKTDQRSRRHHWLSRVNTDHADLALLVCSFVTGLLDASTFANYSVFVGMMTGNTVILCLASANYPDGQPYSWLTTLVSLASFLVGAFITFRLASLLGPPTRRISLFVNFAAQALLIALAAALLTVPGFLPQDSQEYNQDLTLSDPRIVAVIPALALQNGATIATSRLLGLNEIPVNVLTSTYADLMGDAHLFAAHNVKRNRRVAAVVLIFAGALCAAWILRRGPGIMLCLWLGAGLKGIVALSVAFLMPVAEA